MTCRHCNNARANRPRGLCWSCYYRPGVKELYPIDTYVHRFQRRGVPDFYGVPPPPTNPTSAPPGSQEKVVVLAERASLRQSLWHQADAVC